LGPTIKKMVFKGLKLLSRTFRRSISLFQESGEHRAALIEAIKQPLKREEVLTLNYR